MIRINLEKHYETMETLRSMKTLLETERETQLGIIDNMAIGWRGATASTFTTMMPQMLTSGLYDTIYQQTVGMLKLMEDAYADLTGLKCQCNTFENCLRGDAPVKMGRATGDVMVDIDQVRLIDSYVDDVLSKNQQIEETLNTVMDMCEDIVDFVDCREQLYTACRKVERIGCLRDEIDEYARKLVELDEYLADEYAKCYTEDELERVMETRASATVTQDNAIEVENGETAEVKKIREYTNQWDIDPSLAEWKFTDSIKSCDLFPPRRGNDYLRNKKLQYISIYKDVMLDAAEKYDIPQELLAGVAYAEYGGDPVFYDRTRYELGSLIFDDADWDNEDIGLIRNPQYVSFGNIQMQLRRAYHTLGYDEKDVNEKNDEMLIELLEDPVSNIYIAAAHLAELKDIDFEGKTAEELEDEDIKIIAIRYNRGPDLTKQNIMDGNQAYGDAVINNKNDIEEALGLQ